MSYDVGTTPEAIFAVGQTNPNMVQNTGAYTVYLDSQSSVSAQGNSYPLAPGDTTVWAAGQPLWAVTALGTTQLTLTTNTTGSVSSRLHSMTPLPDERAIPLSFDDWTDVFETGAYETLIISLSDPIAKPSANIIPVTGQTIQLTVYWLDGPGSIAGQDSLNNPNHAYVLRRSVYTVQTGGIFSALKTDPYIRVAVPVFGPYAQVHLEPAQSLGGLTLDRFFITGTSRPLPERIQWIGGQYLNGLNNNGNSSDLIATEKTLVWESFAGQLWLDNVAPFLTIDFVFMGAVTTAGFIYIRAAQPNTNFGFVNLAAIPVPAASSSQTISSGKIAVPISMPLFVTAGPYVTTTKVHSTFLWTDN